MHLPACRWAAGRLSDIRAATEQRESVFARRRAIEGGGSGGVLMRIRDDHVRERITTFERLNGRLKRWQSGTPNQEEKTSRWKRDEKLRVVGTRVLVVFIVVVVEHALTRILAEIIWMRLVAQRFAMRKRLKAQESRMRARALMRGVRETALNAVSIFMSEKAPVPYDGTIYGFSCCARSQW